MTPTRIGGIAALAGAALAVFATAVIGGEGGDGPGNPPPLDAHAVHVYPIGGPAGPPMGRPGDDPRVVYRETRAPITVPATSGGQLVKSCPKGWIVVNGYYYKNLLYQGFGLVDQGSSPIGYKDPTPYRPPRKWHFYWDNTTGQAITGVTLGLVCDKDG